VIEERADLWRRALMALNTARADAAFDSDAAASRAYYAAFYAVSAYFAAQGKSFRKHSALEAAVHRELVNAGLWTVERGRDFSALQELRSIGDYGGGRHVPPAGAKEAIAAAERILRAVNAIDPEAFAFEENRS
jgi:uncharacterized protein (UPF0332 family)